MATAQGRKEAPPSHWGLTCMPEAREAAGGGGEGEGGVPERAAGRSQQSGVGGAGAGAPRTRPLGVL